MLFSSANQYLQNLSERKILNFRGVCYQCNFRVKGYCDSLVKSLIGSPLTASLSQAVAKRKAEFVAGRYLAKRALISLGEENTLVRIGPNRAPQWPKNFVGSISHSQEFAICAIANFQDYTKIGIDVENYLSTQTAQSIMGQVLNKSEYEFVYRYKNLDPMMMTLIFSAKESLFKALYPEVGYSFSFEAACIKDIDLGCGLFTLELMQQPSSHLPAGTCFKGIFQIEKDYIFTMIAHPNDAGYSFIDKRI